MVSLASSGTACRPYGLAWRHVTHANPFEVILRNCLNSQLCRVFDGAIRFWDC
jgi:hypothetical protein